MFYKFADVRIFQSLVRRWLEDLKDDMKEPLIACFDFKGNLIYSTNQITCNLYMTVTQMIDGFSPCQVYSVNQIIDFLSNIFTVLQPNSRVINSAYSVVLPSDTLLNYWLHWGSFKFDLVHGT